MGKVDDSARVGDEDAEGAEGIEEGWKERREEDVSFYIELLEARQFCERGRKFRETTVTGWRDRR